MTITEVELLIKKSEIRELKEKLQSVVRDYENLCELLDGFLEKNNLRDEYGIYVLSGQKFNVERVVNNESKS